MFAFPFFSVSFPLFRGDPVVHGRSFPPTVQAGINLSYRKTLQVTTDSGAGCAASLFSVELIKYVRQLEKILTV